MTLKRFRHLQLPNDQVLQRSLDSAMHFVAPRTRLGVNARAVVSNLARVARVGSFSRAY